MTISARHGRNGSSGYTLVEAIVASAVLAITLAAFYGAVSAGRTMLFNANQRLDAESLAFDRLLEVFNTASFTNILVATNLPAQGVPSTSVLPASSEIRAGIFPNIDTALPYKWDVEVSVKIGPVYGRPAAGPENDVVMRATRYAVNRN